ncbi:MAG TPA: ABC transporter ATP-binding protein [Acetobacteraceae bacterium]|jgi:branched-chain amino acid transport system ATP-binding protein|nr:ABC transporter ATP-binding protein [Acetobacteraceae bacterium]
MTMLRLDGVTKRFGSLVANQGISLSLEPREISAVIGPNGAGKTTLFHMITGFLPPTEGRIWFDGHDMTGVPAAARVAGGMVRTFQITEVFPEATVVENLRIGVETRLGLNARPWIPRSLRAEVSRRVEALMAMTGLTDRADNLVGELAHGDQRVVEVTLALSLEPKLLLLDEPTAGMAEHETESMVALIRRLHSERELTILFIEHDMSIVFGIAQRITVLDYGKVLASGTPAEIAADPRVQAAYLGGEA